MQENEIKYTPLLNRDPLQWLVRCEEEEYKASPFDVVIDCVGWRDEWKEAYKRGVLKSAWSGGTFVSIASTDDPQFHTIWQVRAVSCRLPLMILPL